MSEEIEIRVKALEVDMAEWARRMDALSVAVEKLAQDLAVLNARARRAY